MRWYTLERAIGSERIVIRFLWLPRVFAGEFRWLEFSAVRERKVAWKAYPVDGKPCDVVGWRKVGWGNVTKIILAGTRRKIHVRGISST